MSAITGDSSFYTEKICMAPMVRAGRTPLRMLAIDYGADLVYTEEIVDQKLLSATRKENPVLGTIDYCFENDVVLRIAPREREEKRVVLQIGTNNGESAAQIARLVGRDVSAIDVNMGCPKSFSIHAGMGAALLTQTDRVTQIMGSLVATAEVPVSCKIRVLNDMSATLNLVRAIERTGVAAIGVHGRQRDERPQHANREDEIREVARNVGIPVIANGGSGEISSYQDILDFKERTRASSVMVARKALSTPSIFRKEGVLPMEADIGNFLEQACEWDENYTMTKYVVQRILGSEQERDEHGRATVQCGSVLEICRVWGIENHHHKCRLARQKRKGSIVEKDEESGVEYIDVTFPLKRLKVALSGGTTPKCVLHVLCEEKKASKPEYTSRIRPSDKRHEAQVNVCGRKFLSRMGQPNRKMAEQVAALAALIGLNERSRLEGEWEELCM